MTDARIVRTRAALHAAIIDLASQKTVTDITVSELADHAGINRVTFYKHFTSPADTLASALTQELDATREKFLSGYGSSVEDPRILFTVGMDRIFDHVEHHRKLYTLAMSSSEDGTVPHVLTSHFTVTMEQYIRNRRQLEPPLPDFDCQVAAAYFAHGMYGALKTWLLNDSSDREAVTRFMLTFEPDWWHPTAE